MKITESKLKGCFILELKVYEDGRGLFFESYNKAQLEETLGASIDFVQDNISVSKKGVLRGLHFQTEKYAQAKLVQVIKGKVLDIVVDLRRDSNTFGQHFKIELSSENKKSIFIPKGMAHGFLALSEEVVFYYKCDAYYHPLSEAGIVYNDPELKIDWEFPETNMILSEKDLRLPLWKNRKM
ncbi:dTDP-4-dehydrorhamnose 3,5-epimerase [Maribacter polysiphoniae]|uniref:dTDP-4-dehydrorhamnose 3,5-epimerase n=1 Tax=Maribacter polysiphoniae TaxID=429344 RepID=A0A316E5V4_9FLAO|nr:dTDP-4-dehydrorhamnose 3,5-epimerase [Maribacter polysiphoniae]MBD1260017.1 dTDP-4-dehydrorhamnose 3,5-epimerase [Maribacter polysiphoniae]PWK25475.1 dTDP-4-dehydrorhamnose 3,5-epimerase [Maribacter polysiphoniae]